MPDIKRYDELGGLAREINAHHEAAWSGAKIAKEKFDGSLNEALLCGQKLIDVKEEILLHGQFLPWLAKHCPNIAVRTCQRYMQLSRLALNASHSKTHLTANGLRQAYLEMGIWKEPDEATPATAPQAAEAAKLLPLGTREDAPLKLPSFDFAKLKPVAEWQQSERVAFVAWFDSTIAPLYKLREQIAPRAVAA
jgi:hypothetical protein